MFRSTRSSSTHDSPRTPPVGFTLALAVVLPMAAGWGCAAGGGLMDRATELASGRVIDRMETELEEGLGCAVDDEACLEARAAEARGMEGTGGADAQTPPLRPGEGAWANFDFVPGSRILVADDFAITPVGDFPTSLDFVQGSLQVVEWQGSRLLESTGMSRFRVPVGGAASGALLHRVRSLQGECGL